MAISTGAAILGGSLASAGIGALSSKKAAKAQKKGNAAAIAEQRRQFDTILELTQPQREVSNNAMNAIASLLGIGGDGSFNAAATLENLPGNEVIVDDITRRIRQASPTTGGNVLTALADRVSGFQSNRLFDALFRAAGAGASGTNAAVGAASNSGNAISSLLQSTGLANASGVMNTGSAINSGIQNVLQYYALQNMRNNGLRVPGFGGGWYGSGAESAGVT